MDKFINRELSWLEFNQRVLNEAIRPDNPTLERAKFLSIVGSNLDEFFMVRVASLKDQVQAGYDSPDASGLTADAQLRLIHARVQEMNQAVYQLWRKELSPAMADSGIALVEPQKLTVAQRAYVDAYFEEQVYPVLTPMAVDSSRPFPLILNRSLNLGVLLDDEDELKFATVQVPSVLGRVVRLPSEQGFRFMLLEQVIARHIGQLFPGLKVVCCHAYRITRNADLSFDEEDADDLLEEIKKSLLKRRWGAAIRLEIDHDAHPTLLDTLLKMLELSAEEIYPAHGPIGFDFLMKAVYSLPGYDALRDKGFRPRELALGEDESMFDRIAAGDILLYHPYDSFDPVVHLVEEAARDPKVLAIKQTLYRVSGDSPIIAALAAAAEAGKQVTVLLEVKARFDEENNILWGRRLERAGAHVIYGLVGLKVHSKMTLVVRNEETGIKRYVHLATGNYNDVTARIYTDHGMFTANEWFGRDVSALFNMLTGASEAPTLSRLVAAPKHLRDRFLYLIGRETRIAREGGKGEIFAKMNSLVDTEIISALYEASRAGVRVRLIIRGICCLIPGVPEMSEHIEVRSIVGRYLEHSRIFIFNNAGRREVYLSSADWMPRNLDRRVEVMFPVEDAALIKSILSGMALQWKDNVKTSRMLSDGTYQRIAKRPGAPEVNAQERLMWLARREG